MAKATSHHDTHSTTAQGGWSTKRIAVTALFCALAAVCTLFIEIPLLPGVPWLQYDPSGIVALVAGFAFGPAAGATVSIISYLPHIATASGFWGMVMAMLATFSLVMPASLIYQKHTTMKGAIAGMVVGAIVSVLCCIVGNLIVTPIYAGMTTEQVAALIVPALLPFNAAKVLINCVVCGLIYKPVTKALADSE
jgi:riboflavin transporter FmnP